MRAFLLSPASCLLACLFLAGCATVPPPAPPPVLKPAPAKKQSFWNGENAKGPSAIAISLGEQRAYFYRGGKLVGEAVISTGKKRFETPAGNFKISEKDRDHVSNLYGDYVDADGAVVQRNVDVNKDPKPEGAEFRGAKMPFFLRFNGGVGMHAGRVPGYRASHGCVRLPRFMAQHFYENANIGTPVTVAR